MTPDLAHWWQVTAGPLRPGPSPWFHCSRPRCRLVYRSLAYTRPQPPDCPACGQPYYPAAHGPALTSAQREAMSHV